MHRCIHVFKVHSNYTFCMTILVLFRMGSIVVRIYCGSQDSLTTESVLCVLFFNTNVHIDYVRRRLLRDLLRLLSSL